jgi:3-oxoacyl-(acyl-carrier-protein) synthase
VGNACSAGEYALTIALDMIRGGEADVVLVGGAEAPTRVGMSGFDRLGAADPERCRPFDRERRGTMFGDGAAMVVLESAAYAARRGRVRGTRGWRVELRRPPPDRARSEWCADRGRDDVRRRAVRRS